MEFAGYEMPLWYSSTVDEHLAVRNDSGIFDVSHMGRVSIRGDRATEFLESLVPTTVSGQQISKSFYTLLLDEKGGIIDDLIILKEADGYLMIVNAANRKKDLEHIEGRSDPYDVEILDVSDSSTMVAVQGPNARSALQPLVSSDLSGIERHRHVKTTVKGRPATVTRSGYTGEDGFEVILHDSGIESNSLAMSVWTELASRSKPCGLGARDSLRTEAGLPLYGSDIDETTNPFEADLSWVVTKGKTGYVGSERLTASTAPHSVRRGIVLLDKIPRHDFTVLSREKEVIGRVTSGTFSPILKKGIALAYLESANSQVGTPVSVDVRGTPAPGTVVKPPFYDEKLYGWKRLKQ